MAGAAFGAGDCPQRRDRAHDGGAVPGPRGGRGAVVAVAGRSGCGGAGAALVRRPGREIAGPADRPGLAGGASGATGQGRDPGLALAGIPGTSTGRLAVQPVLRALPRLAGAPGHRHAPDPPGRREVVRRLRRAHRRGHRPDHGGGAPGAGLRRRAGGLELHLRRGDLEPAATGLDWRPGAGTRLLWRRARGHHPGQPAQRRQQGAPLRARSESHLPGLRHPLWLRGDPRAGAQAPR